MPELPDLTVYLDALRARIVGRVLRRIELRNPFVLRTAVPPIEGCDGRVVTDVLRVGKRVVLALDGDLYLVIHLMVAGRFRWLAPGAKEPGKIVLARFVFDSGTLLLTEAGTKRRASLHVVVGAAALAALDPGGLEPLAIDEAQFAARLRSASHGVKRALTDPRLFAGIGNAYSDEILHRARMSPFKPTMQLTDAEIAALHAAVRATLLEWTERLSAHAGAGFPEKVTAFRPEMAVHGRFGLPCPVCATPVQRIVYAENETNYCPRCQTGGKILADRALSRLLHDRWPRHVDELG